MGDEATGSADGSAEAPDGIDRDGVEAWFAAQRPRRRAAAHLRADRRRPLEPDLPRHRRRRRQLGAAAAAARQAPRLRPRHGPRAPGRLRARRRPRSRCAPVVGLCEDESVNGAPFYVMEFVEGPILRGLAEAEAFPEEGDRRAIGERVADTLAADPRRRPRRRRPRRPRPQGGLRRPPAAPLAGSVGEVEDARAAGRRPTSTSASPPASPSRARRRSSTATTASTT